MADLSTYEKYKDWLIVLLVSLLMGAFGTMAAGNRGRIEALEQEVRARGPVLENHSNRLSALETMVRSQNEEVFRRLDRIENKVDRLSDR